VVEEGIKQLELLISSVWERNSPLKERTTKMAEDAKEIVERTYAVQTRSTTLSLMPSGANNSGKSFFINHLCLEGNLEELDQCPAGIIPDESWENHLPVPSSALGRNALTVLVTKISYSPRPLTVYLTIGSEEEYTRRKNVARSNFFDTQFSFPTYTELKASIFALAAKHFADYLKSPEDFAEAVTIFHREDESNIFKALAEFRNLFSPFEKEIRDQPMSSLILGVAIHGNFLNLKKYNLQVIDVWLLFSNKPLTKSISISICRLLGLQTTTKKGGL